MIITITLPSNPVHLWAVVFLFLLYITFVYYCAVMRLQQVRDAGKLKFKDHPFRWVMAYFFVLPPAYLADTLLNWIGFTGVGWEKPQEFTTTARFKRWYRTGNWWRKGVAKFFGDEFLDDIDPDGTHIN